MYGTIYSHNLRISLDFSFLWQVVTISSTLVQIYLQYIHNLMAGSGFAVVVSDNYLMVPYAICWRAQSWACHASLTLAQVLQMCHKVHLWQLAMGKWWHGEWGGSKARWEAFQDRTQYGVREGSWARGGLAELCSIRSRTPCQAFHHRRAGTNLRNPIVQPGPSVSSSQFPLPNNSQTSHFICTHNQGAGTYQVQGLQVGCC